MASKNAANIIHAGGVVSIGKDVQRNAEYAKIKQKFIELAVR